MESADGVMESADGGILREIRPVYGAGLWLHFLGRWGQRVKTNSFWQVFDHFGKDLAVILAGHYGLTER